MRLLDIKRLVTIAHEKFDLKFTSNNGGYYIENILESQKAIKALYDSGIYEFNETSINALTELISSKIDKWKVDGGQYNTYKAQSDKIKTVINTFYSWLSRYVPTEETETTINIKLPTINNFTDLTITANCLKKAFSQIVPEAGGNIQVKQLDHGSYWIIIDVGSVDAVYFIGLLVSAAYYIAVKVVNLLKTIEELKSVRLDNQIKEKQIEKDFIKRKAQEEAEKINEEYFGKNKEQDIANHNERKGRICVSLEELVKIIRSGGEIHQSIEAKGNNIDDLYPKYNTSISFTPIALLSKQELNEINDSEENN